MNNYLPLILAGVMINTLAQLTLKQGMRSIGHFSFSMDSLLRMATTVTFNPFVLGGLCYYVLSIVIWLPVLSRVEVSYTYPLLSVGYIVTAFAGWLLFGKFMTLLHWAGIRVLCCGVRLITLTT